MTFTVLGASGFIGSHLAQFLTLGGHEVYCPSRNESLFDRELGNVIYCIGLTADFRKKPFETIEAHVCKLKSVLQYCNFETFTYLSSTRIYIHNTEQVDEESLIPVSVNDPFDLFNSSKLTGELLTLNCGRENTKVVRLSNVIGNDFDSSNFLTSILNDAFKTGKIVFQTTPDSGKDYIGIHDVVRMLFEISVNGKSRIYNLATGSNLLNSEIAAIITQKTGCEIFFEANPNKILFPKIGIGKLEREFSFKTHDTVSSLIDRLIENFKKFQNDPKY